MSYSLRDKKIKRLNLAYKGSRTYIQGGDFFNSLSDAALEVTGCVESYIEKIVFKRFAKNTCCVVTELPEDTSKVIGEVRYRIPTKALLMSSWIVETDSVITNRRPFDEAVILANVQCDPDSRIAILFHRSEYTAIEDVIAVTKHLSYMVTPNVQGKWVFGQLDLTEPLTASYESLVIRMTSLIGGRFSVNDIFVDDRKIGSIRFIVGTN